MAYVSKEGCVFPMVVVSLLPHAELGPNDHREHAPDFTILIDSGHIYFSYRIRATLIFRNNRFDIYDDNRRFYNVQHGYQMG